jgi:hypothetical protein
MPHTQAIDSRILQAALEGLQAQRQRITDQIDRVRERLGSRQAEPAAPEAAAPATPKKRRLSAAGRKAIAEAAQKRWAAQRKREAEEAKHQAEAQARRAAGLAKARAVLAASRKAAERAAAKKAPAKRASAPAKRVAWRTARKPAAKPMTVQPLPEAATA